MVRISPKPTRRQLELMAQRAGHAALRLFGKIGVAYTKKNPNDVVTKADLLSEKILISEIRKRFPDHQIISEEDREAQIPQSDHVWIIDPLDGTRNFATGFPLFCIMIGYMYKKRMHLAAIYCPVMNELYSAERSKGTFFNGRKITCSSVSEFSRAYGCDESYGPRWQGFKLALIKQPGLNGWTSVMNSIGVASSYVSRGVRDWIFFAGSGGIWDYAAPALILQESGCRVTNAKGIPWSHTDRELVAANPRIHPILLRIINNQ
jgi:myo-inositol-1(or 4)-monophosphatase